MTCDPSSLLSPADGPPLETVEGSGRLVLLCDHASNRVPAALGDLGLPNSEFERHIAYDIGMRGVTLSLARRLGAPAALSRFSRLVIDPNRGADDPTLLMRVSDGAIVPGNAKADAAEIARRTAAFHTPYHQAISEMLDAIVAAGETPVIVSMHSFTPVWRGDPRPWHVGLLWDRDDRIAKPLIAALEAEGGLVVGDNEPYDGALVGDTAHTHGTSRGFPHVLVEIRQDLVADDAGQEAWAERFARLLPPLLALPETARVVHYGSHAEIERS